MVKELYYVANNGLCGVDTFQVEKETDKTYRLKDGYYKQVRKDCMRTTYGVFFTDYDEAENYYNGVITTQKEKYRRLGISSEKNIYVFIEYDHKSMKRSEMAVVALPNRGQEYIDEMEKEAEEKLCKKLGLPYDEVLFYAFKYLGENLIYVD